MHAYLLIKHHYLLWKTKRSTQQGSNYSTYLQLLPHVAHSLLVYATELRGPKCGHAETTVNVQCLAGRGNSIIVSVSVCQSNRPGSSPAQSICFVKKILSASYRLVPASADDWFTKGDNACKRSLAICRKSRALCQQAPVFPYIPCMC